MVLLDAVLMDTRNIACAAVVVEAKLQHLRFLFRDIITPGFALMVY